MTETLKIATQCLQDEAQAILGLIPQLGEQFEQVVESIVQCKGKVIVTGVGKSGHIGAKIAATLSSTGTPSFYVNPLDVYHGDLGVIESNDIVIAISNSGQTDELLRFVPFLREEGVTIVAMTGNAQSLLARNSDYHLEVVVREEAYPLNLAPTCSTTATLAMGDALACALIARRQFRAADFARFHPGGSLGKRLLTSARDVMRSTDLPTMPPSLPLGEAVIRVSEGKLGLCVAIENDKVIGLITDGDVRRAMQKLRNRFFDVPVSEVMTRFPKCVRPDTKISDIQEILHANMIHTVLVTDEEKHLLGVVDHFSCML